MSDETTKTDAEVIAHYRKWRTEPHPSPSERIELYVQIEGYAIVADAALRTIDALTAERDAARAELARLREACEGVPGWLDDASDKLNTDMPWQYACYDAPWRYGEDDPLAIIRAKADAIRAALGEDVQP